jgi:23S rRNA pseudouridine2605 synthase
MARAGVASRRHAETMIAAGRVKVNGNVARVGQGIDPAVDHVTLDGRDVPLGDREESWIVFHKPVRVMTTRSDPQGRATVFDYVENAPGLTYVGRLDFDTEGVLLMTTDGDAVHRLTHPSSRVERVYVATVVGDAPAAAARAKDGVLLPDGLVQPLRVAVRPAPRGRWEFEVVIAEGRKREVRRLCKALRLAVERLVRTEFGPVKLGQLAAGATRLLSPEEREALALLMARGDP